MLPGGKTSSTDIGGILASLGLSEREAKVYLELARAGILTAPEAAKKVNMARSEAYEVLKKLENKGFVKQQIGKPIRFEPVGPIELRARILHKEKQRLTSIEEGMTRILELWPYLKTLHVPKDELPRIATLRSRKRIASAVESLMVNAQETVDIATTRRGLMTAMEHDFPVILKGLFDRGVHVRLLIDESSMNRSRVLIPENVETKISKGPKVRFYIFDNQDVVYHLHLMSEDDLWGSDETAIWTDSSDQVNVYRWLFQNEWSQGTQFKRMLPEIQRLQRKARR